MPACIWEVSCKYSSHCFAIPTISCVHQVCFSFWDRDSLRYLIGNSPLLNPIISNSLLFTSSDTLTINILDLSYLVFNPIVSKKYLRASIILPTDCSVPLQKIIRSSTKVRWVSCFLHIKWYLKWENLHNLDNNPKK